MDVESDVESSVGGWSEENDTVDKVKACSDVVEYVDELVNGQYVVVFVIIDFVQPLLLQEVVVIVVTSVVRVEEKEFNDLDDFDVGVVVVKELDKIDEIEADDIGEDNVEVSDVIEEYADEIGCTLEIKLEDKLDV